MDAGTLDRRITISRATTTKSTIGEDTQTWANLATVWASATPVKDAEKQEKGQINAERAYRFVIRWSSVVSRVNAKDRVIFDGLTYEVWGVKELGRREGLEISATTRADT